MNSLIESNKATKDNFKNYVENKALSHTKQWWETIGKHLDQMGMKLPFALMADSAKDIFNEISLNLKKEVVLKDETDDIKLQKKLIKDSIDYLNKTHFNIFQETFAISNEKLMIDNIEYGDSVFSMLVKKGIINQGGEIINFEP